jgi:hypothetical protein
MTNDQTVRFEMLVRVREFGEKHQNLFPEGTEGKDALGVIVDAVAQLEAQAKSKAASEREGVGAKAGARQALSRQLEDIARSARVIAADTPGFDGAFTLPRPRSDQKLLTSGRAFIDAAGAAKDRFIRFGMAADFVATLSVAVDVFADAVRTLESGRIDTTQARKDISATLKTAIAAAQRLDAFFANVCRNDPATLGVWQECRAVDYGRRVRRPRAKVEPDAAPDVDVKVAS